MVSEESSSINFLLMQVAKLHYKKTSLILETIGLYYGQPPLLKLLSKHEGLTQKELADLLGVQPATIAKMINRMEHNDLLTRAANPGDKRTKKIYLTPKARGLLEKVDQLHKVIGDETFKDFTPEEKMLLRRFLTQIKDNLLGALCKGCTAKEKRLEPCIHS